jgi:hypothetical protein
MWPATGADRLRFVVAGRLIIATVGARLGEGEGEGLLLRLRLRTLPGQFLVKL